MTGQKAEPVGMKLTLFLSGQEKRGTDADADCLELRRNISSVSEGYTLWRHFSCVQHRYQSIPHLLKSLNLLTALWWLSLKHVAVVGFGRRGKLGQW